MVVKLIRFLKALLQRVPEKRSRRTTQSTTSPSNAILLPKDRTSSPKEQRPKQPKFSIEDITDQVKSRSGDRDLSKVKYLIVHRIGVGENGLEVAKWFESHSEAGTGRRMPYHYIVSRSGCTQQCLPLSDRGAHAVRYNSASVGVACIGDFRKQNPTPEQNKSLIRLLTELKRRFPTTTIARHDELPGASTDPFKVCPGPLLKLDHIKQQVGILECL